MIVVSTNGAVHVVIKIVGLFLKALAGSYAGRVDAEKDRGRRLRSFWFWLVRFVRFVHVWILFWATGP